MNSDSHVTEKSDAEQSGMVTFSLPAGNADFASFTVLIFYQIFFTILIFSQISGNTASLIIAGAVNLVVFILLSLFLLRRQPGSFFGNMFKVTVDDRGIKSGFRYMHWEDLGRVKLRTFFYLFPSNLILKTDKKKVSFWQLKPSSTSFSFQYVPEIHNGILPLIKKYRPDIELPANIAEPEVHKRRRNAVNTAVAVIVALMQITLLMILIRLFSSGNMFKGFFYSIFLLYSLNLIQPAIMPEYRKERALSVLCAVISATAIGVVILILFYFGILLHYMILLILYTNISMLILGILLLFMKRWKFITYPPVLFIIMSIIAALNFYTHYSPQTPMRDITSFLAEKDESAFLFWSEDGRYLVNLSSRRKENERTVFDTLENRNIAIPAHNINGASIRWLDSSYIVRTGETGKKEYSLFIYSFGTDKEYILDSARSIYVSRNNPLRHCTNELIWIAEKSDGTVAVKTALLDNTDSPEIKKLPFDLPSEYMWNHVEWLNNGAIICLGRKKQKKERYCRSAEKEPLILYRYNPETEKGKLIISDFPAERWYPLPGFTHAFAISEKNNRSEISFVNLTDGSVKKVTGHTLPSWVADEQYGFRIVQKDGQNLFCRFDLHCGEESVIAPAPDGFLLAGVSHDGKFAVFASNGLLKYAIYRILDIDKMNWYSVDCSSIIFANISDNSFILSSPLFSICSPAADSVILTGYHFHPFNDEGSQVQVVLKLLNISDLTKDQLVR